MVCDRKVGDKMNLQNRLVTEYCNKKNVRSNDPEYHSEMVRKIKSRKE